MPGEKLTTRSRGAAPPNQEDCSVFTHGENIRDASEADEVTEHY